MGRIVGIDLGTTYSCVAIFNSRKGVFEVLPNKDGHMTTPSVVALGRSGEVLVGSTARSRMKLDPENAIIEIKRHMGELGADGRPYSVRFGGRDQTPEEISSYILRYLKESAERALNEPVTAAVITVPAYFKEPQREATMRAGRMAGMEVKRIINEPTAAAIAYGHDKANDGAEDEDADVKRQRLLIYDLGGGTFDVSILELEPGNIKVCATHGDHYLGGVDFDRAIANWVSLEVRARYGVDLEAAAAQVGKPGERARKALALIRAEAEERKKELSTQESTSLSFPALAPDSSGEMIDVELELSRAQFEQMIGAKIQDTLKSVDFALKDARFKTGDIDDVILVGGSTRIPMVKRLLTKHFGKEPRTDIHPDLCVALGAAHEAIKYVDVADVPVEERSSVQEKQNDVHAVSEITGHSLGVEVEGQFMSVQIQRQSPIPTSVSQSYSPGFDGQPSVNIRVFQGEERLTARNTLLGEFRLENLPKLPKEQVRIDVTFNMDSNGVLLVTAKDAVTGQQREITISKAHARSEGAPPPASPPAPVPFQSTVPVGAAPRAPMAVGPPPAPVSAPAPPLPDNYRRVLETARAKIPQLSAQDAQRVGAAIEALLSAARSQNSAAIDAAGKALVSVVWQLG